LPGGESDGAGVFLLPEVRFGRWKRAW